MTEENQETMMTEPDVLTTAQDLAECLAEAKILALSLMTQLPEELINVCVSDMFSAIVQAEKHTLCVLNNVDRLVNEENPEELENLNN